MRVLLVEDDLILGDGIKAGLEQDGYVVVIRYIMCFIKCLCPLHKMCAVLLLLIHIKARFRSLE